MLAKVSSRGRIWCINGREKCLDGHFPAISFDLRHFLKAQVVLNVQSRI
jgi:hypothetical protein